MAQRTEKEETEFKSVPETITLCINNCGVVGNPSTKNMCQKCFSTVTSSSPSSSSSSTSVTLSSLQQRNRVGRSGGLIRSLTKSTVIIGEDLVLVPDETGNNMTVDDVVKKPTKVVNRCSGCRKRVGLTGFRCRCGDLYCAEHRYSDRHDCSYDYKTAGREAIARDNPVVKAAKIVRI